MMSATNGWRASSVSIAVLAIASIAGGCMCSGICDSETRLTASVYPTINENERCASGPVNTNEIGADYIVALITDKMQLARVNLPRLLKSSQTPVDFDFMRFFNWSDKDKFVTRSSIVIAPVKPGIDASGDRMPKKGVILYPDRDPNGMLYIQLVLIEKCKPKKCDSKDKSNACEPRECKPETNDWMKGLVLKSALNGTPIDGRSRLWSLWNDLSAQSEFATALLSNVEDDEIVSWNTFSFFEKDLYGFSGGQKQKTFPLWINSSTQEKSNSSTLCLEVSVWNRAPS